MDGLEIAFYVTMAVAVASIAAGSWVLFRK